MSGKKSPAVKSSPPSDLSTKQEEEKGKKISETYVKRRVSNLKQRRRLRKPAKAEPQRVGAFRVEGRKKNDREDLQMPSVKRTTSKEHRKRFVKDRNGFDLTGDQRVTIWRRRK